MIFSLTLGEARTTPFFTFSITFHIFIVVGHRDFKFGISASPGGQTVTERGVVRSREPLTFLWTTTISLERL